MKITFKNISQEIITVKEFNNFLEVDDYIRNQNFICVKEIRIIKGVYEYIIEEESNERKEYY